MSKIITKQQLDLVIENTIKDFIPNDINESETNDTPIINEEVTKEVENFKRFINYNNK